MGREENVIPKRRGWDRMLSFLFVVYHLVAILANRKERKLVIIFVFLSISPCPNYYY